VRRAAHRQTGALKIAEKLREQVCFVRERQLFRWIQIGRPERFFAQRRGFALRIQLFRVFRPRPGQGGRTVLVNDHSPSTVPPAAK
jgi:hypothetical protein